MKNTLYAGQLAHHALKLGSLSYKLSNVQKFNELQSLMLSVRSEVFKVEELLKNNVELQNDFKLL